MGRRPSAGLSVNSLLISQGDQANTNRQTYSDSCTQRTGCDSNGCADFNTDRTLHAATYRNSGIHTVRNSRTDHDDCKI